MSVAETVGWHDKALWSAGRERAVKEYVADGHSLFDGSITWPAMVLREDALDHNITTLAAFCREHGLDFAPHGKTSMAPALFQRQLDAGAWGVTVATAQQLRVARGFGISHVLVAHQVLDATALNWMATELARDPLFKTACLVDSPEGVAAAAAAGRAQPDLDGFPVILDVGYLGGRTGVRTLRQAHQLAALIADTDGVRLLGVCAYEGGLPDPDAVRVYFAAVRQVVEDLAKAGLLPTKPIVTAGGSAYFDLVASELGGQWATDQNAHILLRSGAYVTHDDGVYARKGAYNRIPNQGGLQAALELWAQVVSAPEPGLALAGMGKRDAPYDEGMPVPMRVRRPGTGSNEDILGRARVPKMDDQHCYLQLTDGLMLRPGDLVCFGISHPCTAFDKWRALPVLDASDRVVDVIRTYF